MNDVHGVRSAAVQALVQLRNQARRGSGAVELEVPAGHWHGGSPRIQADHWHRDDSGTASPSLMDAPYLVHVGSRPDYMAVLAASEFALCPAGRVGPTASSSTPSVDALRASGSPTMFHLKLPDASLSVADPFSSTHNLNLKCSSRSLGCQDYWSTLK